MSPASLRFLNGFANKENFNGIQDPTFKILDIYIIEKNL